MKALGVMTCTLVSPFLTIGYHKERLVSSLNFVQNKRCSIVKKTENRHNDEKTLTGGTEVCYIKYVGAWKTPCSGRRFLVKENHQQYWWFQKAFAMPRPAVAESLPLMREVDSP